MRRLSLFLVCTLFITACSNSLNEESNQEANNYGGDNQYADFQSAIPTEWQVQLPTKYPVAENQFLTAKTTSSESEIVYEFYQFDKKIALDAPNVADGNYIGKLTVTRYEDEFKADKDVLVELTLHDDYIADAGAELIYPFTAGDESVVNWTNSFGWYIFAYSREKSEQALVDWIKAEDLVNETTNGTNDGYFPRPQIVGQMHFYADDTTRTFIKWAENEIVFTLNDFSENTLDWLHAFGE